MPIKRIFSRKDDLPYSDNADEHYVEVNVMDAEEHKRVGAVGIRIEKLSDFGDTDRILRQIRTGSVIFLKIKDLREKDMGELKRAIDKLKKAIMANNGDIAGVESDWLILTPEYASIERGN